MPDAPVDPRLYVVGCPRSGTTLLQRMLDHHSQLAVANDTHFVVRAIEKHAAARIPQILTGERLPLDRSLIDGVLGYHRFARLGLPAESVERAAAASEDYRSFVAHLYTVYAASHDKPYGGEKTPDFVRRLPLLAALCPDSRFVHIVRDGRDVALSTLDWAHERKGPGKWALWQQDPVVASGLWWSWQVGAGRLAGEALGDRYHELRYEDLIAEPTAELRRITEAIGLPFERNMLDYHRGRERSRPGRSAKQNWLRPTAGLRDWRTQLPETDLAAFEAVAATELRAAGYELQFDSTAPATARRISEPLVWWERFLDRRRRKERRRIALGEPS